MIHKLLRAAAVLGLPSQTPYPSEGITSSIDGWSPKPTQGPLGNGLVRRQSDDRTCGYINGISSMFCSLSFRNASAMKVPVVYSIHYKKPRALI